MAEGDQVPERAGIEKLIDERDKKYLNPTERAIVLYEMLHKEHPQLTTWDLICFSAYWLLTMSAQFAWLKPAAKELARLVTFAHYHMDEEGLVSVLTRDQIEQIETSHQEKKSESTKSTDTQG